MTIKLIMQTFAHPNVITVLNPKQNDEPIQKDK